ncbi:hypothetical protein F383_20774 [Gossypium arboreum]|uniref:Uncharacterized protein n=1 Tax=Gossypium arboreum TaxID=29729 RepID=A0A0B0NS92_GOSAR|nr:hypothetical protein F383_20774 [Gossypium arboreum]
MDQYSKTKHLKRGLKWNQRKHK